MNVLYTNGVIAVKETMLLKDKIYRLCELTKGEAFRMLQESGFGSGVDTDDIERLLEKEESELDAFIGIYAPSEAEKCYLLAPRDFHNAKAILKAEFLKSDAEKLLAPEGTIPIDELKEKITNRDFSLPKELADSIREAIALFESEESVSGAELGGVFERGLYRMLRAVCRRKPLKTMIAQKADMVNLLTAFRSASAEYAEKFYVEGGTLKTQQLAQVFSEGEKRERAFDGTKYEKFYALCLRAKEEGKPFTEAEKMLDSFEAEFFFSHRFEMHTKLPFSYYVFRRRAEIQNVRMIFVCREAGLSEEQIKKRLRAM